MVCRVWRGWTKRENAPMYDHYLQKELFPRLAEELLEQGFRGYQLLRRDRENETEFMTMVYFESLEQVRSFAGENYETPVISAKAQALLSHYAERAEHYEVSGFNPLPSTS
ncbi:MAG TPA: antibiotic biosynthesis monooxygenase [Terriglobales bacterium]|nr:antibiotic biosynthesis monooxygenase [Terriglobales bacterium]